MSVDPKIPSTYGTTVRAVDGSHFDLARPDEWDGAWRPIAQGLAHTCRFGGQIPAFYSVAEHSVVVSLMLANAGAPPEVQLAGLVHDAHEAFYGDVVKPMKPLVPALCGLMDVFDVRVEQLLGLRRGALHDGRVKEADDAAIRIEAGVLWTPPPSWAFEPTPERRRMVECWPPPEALEQWLELFDDLAPAGVDL